MATSDNIGVACLALLSASAIKSAAVCPVKTGIDLIDIAIIIHYLNISRYKGNTFYQYALSIN
jgi:hypothetical protein